MCHVALQTRHQQTWTSWSSQLCVTVFAGTCRISLCLSSPLRCILRWSTRPKVRRLFCNSSAFAPEHAIEHPVLRTAHRKTSSMSCSTQQRLLTVFLFTLLFFFFFRSQVLAEFSYHTLFSRAALFCCQQARNRISVVNKS